MKKRWMRLTSILLTMTMILGSTVSISATAADGNAIEATTLGEDAADTKNTDGTDSGAEQQEQETPDENNATVPDDQGAAAATTDTESSSNQTPPETETQGSQTGDVSGTVTTDNSNVSGTVTVETDKNDDNVKIKKNDRPYLALGVDLTEEQRATVLSLMGIDAGQLGNYDVVYVNNSEEHQYLDSYIDSSKIGTKSLSSIVIVERKDGNGINISTNNISYCTVGMYKNALATAGIEDADIIVAAPFAISGTAALVGIFKAYKEMTGDDIDEENIDAALNELVVTGALESSGSNDADEIEGMIAYVKQAVVEHDLTDESEIREAIAEGCDKFNITLTEEEINEIVQLMLKIGDLDLDLDSLLNSAQSIYDKISHADGGFWAKIGDILSGWIDKLKELFS